MKSGFKDRSRPNYVFAEPELYVSAQEVARVAVETAGDLDQARRLIEGSVVYGEFRDSCMYHLNDTRKH